MSDTTSDFRGLHVAAFESRRAEDVVRLIEKHGGVPHVSPSMRETPLDDHRSAVDFAHRLITGEVDIVVFLTGVGFQELLAIVRRHVARQRYLDALSDIVTIARGPKPAAAMKEAGPDADVPRARSRTPGGRCCRRSTSPCRWPTRSSRCRSTARRTPA